MQTSSRRTKRFGGLDAIGTGGNQAGAIRRRAETDFFIFRFIFAASSRYEFGRVSPFDTRAIHSCQNALWNQEILVLILQPPF